MVGLSVVLENQKNGSIISTRKPTQIINKTTMLDSPSVCRNSSVKNFPVPVAFLDYCFLCRQKLLPGKDIYMYKGDRAFCSVECRCRQIFMDEEESIKKENCSLAAIKPPQTTVESASPSTSSSSSSGSRNRRAERNRGVGFAC
ncbi:hypothetical protein SLA2020_071790 [Shorea laevis]